MKRARNGQGTTCYTHTSLSFFSFVPVCENYGWVYVLGCHKTNTINSHVDVDKRFRQDMSQITIPSSRRTSRRALSSSQTQQSDATSTAVIEKVDMSKRVRLELETVQGIVGQVHRSYMERT